MNRMVTNRFAMHSNRLHELLMATVFGNDTVEVTKMTLCPFFCIINADALQIRAPPGTNSTSSFEIKSVQSSRTCPYCSLQYQECLCGSHARQRAFAQYARNLATAGNARALLVIDDLSASLGLGSGDALSDTGHRGIRSDAFAEFCRSMTGQRITSSAVGDMEGVTTLQNSQSMSWRVAPGLSWMGNQTPGIRELKMAYLTRRCCSEPQVDSFLHPDPAQREVESEPSRSLRGLDLAGRRPKRVRRRAHKCLQCESVFLQRSHLMTHVDTVHTKLRSYPCLVCGTSFGTRSNLTRHERTVHQK